MSIASQPIAPLAGTAGVVGATSLASRLAAVPERYRRAIIVGPADIPGDAGDSVAATIGADVRALAAVAPDGAPAGGVSSALTNMPAGVVCVSKRDSNRLTAKPITDLVEVGTDWFGERASLTMWRFAPDVRKCGIAMRVVDATGRLRFTQNAMTTTGLRNLPQAILVLSQEPAVYLIDPTKVRLP